MWPNPQFTVDLVTLTEEILMRIWSHLLKKSLKEKLDFLYSGRNRDQAI